MPVLRDYQARAVEQCESHLHQGLCPILVSPTGSGKTVTFVSLAQRLARKTLVVAHRRELIFQARHAVEEAGGVAGLILAGEPYEPDAPFQIASVQTLATRGLPDGIDLAIIDEAHHATSPSYRKVVAKYPRRLGATATPFRLDGKGLRTAGFDVIVVAAYTDDLCAQGTLHEPTVYAAPAPDVSHVKVTAGDYNLAQLGDAVRAAHLDGKIVETWKKRADGRRTVAFTVDVAHAGSVVKAFLAAGVPAEMVSGETPKPLRAGILARLAAGITRVVANCAVLTEGWDLPALEAAIVARPTASLNLHLQMIGRIMRACPGKDGALVLDHAGNTYAHGLVTRRLLYSLDGKVKAAKGAAPLKNCPDCGRVIPAATRVCPECGYEFPREDKTVERDVELVPVGHGDTFAMRAHRWQRMRNDAERIVRWKSESFWDGACEKRAAAIASTKYHARYGEWPIALGDRLLDPARITPPEWAALRERWTAIARGRGWDDEKTLWFVRKCVSDAEARAKRGSEQKAKAAS